MKTLNYLMLIALIALGSVAANAGSLPTTEQMQDCYRAHHQLMDKPSVKTLEACWRQHHQMMK